MRTSSKHPFQSHGFDHREPSAEYRAWIDGEEVYVHNQIGFAGGTVSWIIFDLREPVEIRVQPHRQVDEVRVLPRRADLPIELEENVASLLVAAPADLMLEWDDELELPFHIFARPPYEALPPSAGRRIEFGPGKHQPGRIVLESGDELHLASGAEVFGCIYAVDAENIRVTGRGMLRQSHLPFGGRGDERHPVELIRCRHVLMDGPMFVDGCTWNIVFRDCDDVVVRNLTVLSERPYSTDGINPCDCRDVLIERCFVRCKDDCISVKGLQRKVPVPDLKPINGITVRDCVFWSDNNNGLVVGTETWASVIHGVRFERIDFVRVTGTCGDWAAAFAVQALADTEIHDIIFDDIQVEYCTGNPFSILYLDSVYGIPGERRAGGARIHDLTFHNIHFHHAPRRHSLVLGMDAERTVDHIAFHNITYGAEVISSPRALRLETNEFTSDIQITP